MKLLTPKKERGAVSKQGKRPSRVHFKIPALVPVVLVCMLTLLVFGLFKVGESLLQQQVDKVSVTGELRYVKKDEVINEVKPFLEQGFVRLNMQAMREKLLSLPWVYEVRVQRQWPNEVRVNIVEQQAIAQWGKRGYLNHRGELFKPSVQVQSQNLPLLIGPEGSAKELIESYRAVGLLLRDYGLELKSLSVNERGSWQAELMNDVTVLVGREQLMEKMQRFVYVYRKTLASDMQAIKKIDMRYSQGLAVSWRQQT